MLFELPAYAWAWIGLLAAAAVYCLLRTVTGTIRHEVEVHDLQVKVRRLREEYARRLRVLAGEEDEEVVGVDIVADDGTLIDPDTLAPDAPPTAPAEGVEIPEGVEVGEAVAPAKAA